MINTHFKIVLIDETSDWREDIVAKAGTIKTVYLYDETRTINLAEITPSFELTPLYYVSEHPVDDETDEDMLTGFGQNDPIYMHCNKVSGHYDLGAESHDEDNDDQGYETVLNKVIDQERSNRRVSSITVPKSPQP